MLKEGKREAAQECGSSSVRNGDICEEISFNPNVFTEFKLAGGEEVSLVFFLETHSVQVHAYLLFIL